MAPPETGERTAFLGPTKQLARQVCAKSVGYGIEPVLLIESSDCWDPAQQTKFDRGEAIAITNYNHVFNRTPRIDAQTLILDDAHTRTWLTSSPASRIRTRSGPRLRFKPWVSCSVSSPATVAEAADGKSRPPHAWGIPVIGSGEVCVITRKA